MIIPTRCFTCGKVISDRWNEFQQRIEEDGEDPADVLDDLGVERYCCRSIFVTHVDLSQDVAAFKKE